jgi:hypothetical protein
MNDDTNPVRARGDAAEREWQAQERALRDEQQGVHPAASDPAARRYRAIAQALRQPPQAQLPVGFAQRTARRIVQMAVPDTRLERNLIRVLVAVFALAAVGATVLYGRDWVPALTAGIPARWLTDPWLAALAVCLGLSGLVARWLPEARSAR